MNKRNLLIALLLVGFFAAGGWSAMHYYQSSVTRAEEGTPPDNTYYPPKNDKVLAAEIEKNRVLKEELEHGCVTESFGNKVLCEKSAERARIAEEKWRKAWLESQLPSQEILSKRLQAIRDLREDQSLTIEFTGESGNVYLSNNTRRMEGYQDNQGMYYTVDKISGIITNFQPTPSNSPKSFRFTPELSKSELKKRGLAYLTQHVKDFKTVQKEFSFQENSKGENAGDGHWTYALRWEGQKTPGEDMPPFLQIVMTAGGDIATFNDTRILYSE